ncbi:MAG TPA: hypoxanthine-guanine phosphoribosyltransferase [Gammaproteobacteria bacterium]|nr:hypoxanthine-guanine phosphoribosyltransferase [Gammaproteobacteria bacterium]
MSDLLAEIERVQREAELLHSEQAVQAALKSLAGRITKILADSNPLVLCVMNGGLVPTGWLLPMLRFPLQLDYIHATRYRGGTRGHDLEWRVRPEIPVRARSILLIDDIFDEGVTLTHVVDYCSKQGAQQVFTAVLIRKQRMHNGLQPDFVGLEAPDRYLFGCGLDYKNYLRNLPAIYAMPDDFDRNRI